MREKEPLTTTSFRLSDNVRSQLKILEGELYSQGIRKANDVLKHLLDFYFRNHHNKGTQDSPQGER